MVKYGESVCVLPFCRRMEKGETQGVIASVLVSQGNIERSNIGSQCMCPCFAGKQ